jgi:CTP:molybdopterin cytidylyltransferase MocA
VIGSAATATSEAPRSVAVATGLQQVAAAMTAVMTMAVTAPSIPPAPAPVSGSQAAAVEVLDDDTPPPG